MLKQQPKGAAIWADVHRWTLHCVRLSERSTFHLHLSISYQFIWGWQHLQKPSPKCHFTYTCLLFLFPSGAPPMTAEARTDPQLPATASNVYTPDSLLGGVGRVTPPNKYPAVQCVLLLSRTLTRVFTPCFCLPLCLIPSGLYWCM